MSDRKSLNKIRQLDLFLKLKMGNSRIKMHIHTDNLGLESGGSAIRLGMPVLLFFQKERLSVKLLAYTDIILSLQLSYVTCAYHFIFLLATLVLISEAVMQRIEAVVEYIAIKRP